MLCLVLEPSQKNYVRRNVLMLRAAAASHKVADASLETPIYLLSQTVVPQNFPSLSPTRHPADWLQMSRPRAHAREAVMYEGTAGIRSNFNAINISRELYRLEREVRNHQERSFETLVGHTLSSMLEPGRS